MRIIENSKLVRHNSRFLTVYAQMEFLQHYRTPRLDGDSMLHLSRLLVWFFLTRWSNFPPEQRTNQQNKNKEIEKRWSKEPRRDARESLISFHTSRGSTVNSIRVVFVGIAFQVTLYLPNQRCHPIVRADNSSLSAIALCCLYRYFSFFFKFYSLKWLSTWPFHQIIFLHIIKKKKKTIHEEIITRSSPKKFPNTRQTIENK